MSLEINEEKKTLFFKEELTIFEIEKITDYLKNALDNINQWESFSVDLSELENIDSSGIQLLLCLNKTYPEKIQFNNPTEEIKKLLHWHGLKLVKKESVKDLNK